MSATETHIPKYRLPFDPAHNTPAPDVTIVTSAPSNGHSSGHSNGHAPTLVQSHDDAVVSLARAAAVEAAQEVARQQMGQLAGPLAAIAATHNGAPANGQPGHAMAETTLERRATARALGNPNVLDYGRGNGYNSHNAYAMNDPRRWNDSADPRARPYRTLNTDTLRNLAQTYDVMAACIAHLKDEVIKVPVLVSAKDEKDKSKSTLAEVAEAEEFLDVFGGLGGVGTTRLEFEGRWLDDLIIIGAGAIFMDYATRGARRDKNPDACIAIDSSTIRPLLDPFGFLPGDDADVFEQVVMGVPVARFQRHELIYRGLPIFAQSYSPYFNSPVELLAMVAFTALKSDEWNRTWLTDGNIPDYLIQVPKEWTPDQIKEFAEYFDALLSGDSAARHKARIVPDGAHGGSPTRKEQDFQAFEKWLSERCMSLMGVNPASIGHNGGQYEANQDAAMESTRENRVAQILLFRNVLYNEIVRRKGWMKIKVSDHQTDAEDAKTKAGRNQVLIGSGQRTINECRVADGLDPLPDEGTDMLFIPSAWTPLERAIAEPPAGPQMGPDGLPVDLDDTDPDGDPNATPEADKLGEDTADSGDDNGADDTNDAPGVKRAEMGLETQITPVARGEWKEADHPRADNGQFGSGGKPAEVDFKSVSDNLEKWEGRGPENLSGEKPTKTVQFKGYTMDYYPLDDGDGEILAHKDGQLVGSLFMGTNEKNKFEGAVEVHPHHRRKGIASKLYELGEEYTGRKFEPAEKHTPYAEAFWQNPNRKFGRMEPVELERGEHNFSCAMLYLGDYDADRVKQYAATVIDPADLAPAGLENDPHITVLWGIHTNDVQEVQKVLAKRQGENFVTAKVGGISIFPASEAGEHDVVKLDILPDNFDLLDLRANLMAELENTQTHNTYQPHITLAYVKPGMGAKYASDKGPLTGETLMLSKLVFSNQDDKYTTIDLYTGAEEKLQRALSLWQRKCLNRVKAGKPAVCHFQSTHLLPEDVELVRGMLLEVNDRDGVLRVFQSAEEVLTDLSRLDTDTMLHRVLVADGWYDNPKALVGSVLEDNAHVYASKQADVAYRTLQDMPAVEGDRVVLHMGIARGAKVLPVPPAMGMEDLDEMLVPAGMKHTVLDVTTDIHGVLHVYTTAV